MRVLAGWAATAAMTCFLASAAVADFATSEVEAMTRLALLDESSGPRSGEDEARPATAADLERVRQEIQRLATAQRELARRLDDGLLPTAVPAADPPSDGTAALAPLLLVVGAVSGFVASRLLQGRRDRKQRNRLRL